MASENTLLNEKLAASHLGLSTSVLRSWRCKTRGICGPSFIRVGRSIRYRLTDLESWLSSRTVAGDAMPEVGR